MIFVIFLFITGCLGTSPQCIDENGRAVDWFYIYKIPKQLTHANPLVKRGVAYMYMTPATLKKGWVLSKYSIRSLNSMAARTLAPLYENPKLMSVMYNDQPPIQKKLALKPKPRSKTSAQLSKTASTTTSRPSGSRKRYKRRVIETTSKPTTHTSKTTSKLAMASTTKAAFHSDAKKTTPFVNISTSSTFSYEVKSSTSKNIVKQTTHANNSKLMKVINATRKPETKYTSTPAYKVNLTTLSSKSNLTFSHKEISTTIAPKVKSSTLVKLSTSTSKTKQTTISPVATSKHKANTTTLGPKSFIRPATQPTTTTTTTTTKSTPIILGAKSTLTKNSREVRRVGPKGFSKGVIIGDEKNSLWIVHSVAKFPLKPNGTSSNASYNFPLTGVKYGQSFFCVSVATGTLDQISLQMKYNDPLIYHHRIPESLEKKLPNLIDIVNNKTVDSTPWYRIHTFSSLGGRKFLSFAKNGKLKADLYAKVVAPKLKSDLFVQSWPNGPGVLASDCSDSYQVHNIETLTHSGNKLAFPSILDQSKWTLTASLLLRNKLNTSNLWVCVGDMNRVESQESRGGGAVCIPDPTVWDHFAQLISSVKPCMRTSKSRY